MASANPNVDYYSAGLYHSLRHPADLFTSIFATARTARLRSPRQNN
jgi:citrate synthase